MEKLKFLLSCIVLNLTLIFLGLINSFSIQFFFKAILLFVFGIFLAQKSPYKRVLTFVSIYGIWFLIISSLFIYSFFASGFLGTPYFIVTVICITIVLSVDLKNKTLLTKVSIIYFFFVCTATYILPNYYAYIFHYENKVLNQEIPNIKLVDEKGFYLNIKKQKGKIIVIDFWNSGCSNCIKKNFPKFEKLKKEYEKDSNILFFSVNLPLKMDINQKQKIKEVVSKYSFKTYYADYNATYLLNIKAVPIYMIIDRESKIKYLGALNIDRAIYYNNFYDIINEIK